MPKKSKTKVRLKKSDVWRTVLTDTAPFEVPIIFSNDGFYKNLSDLQSRSELLQKFVETIVLKQRKFTVPFRYSIVKGEDSLRTLSLVHPHGQVEVAHFYQEYNQLICEYGNRSPYSIRKPTKVGTSYFFDSPVADKNKYKNATVDTTEIDTLVRNPASYFSYSGFDRLYRFFLSDDHIRLEKKFKLMCALDISKCFDSIYTHSIAWATKSKKLAKDSIGAQSFGNDFDSIMQKLNYNETSGICIGPEASRIFAEIILARVDKNTSTRLENLPTRIKMRQDYESRRYVDNYYIFANTKEDLATIQHELTLALREYNLHLNELKTEIIKRPFYTRKSLVIDRVDLSIKKLWEKTLDHDYHEGRRIEFPRHIYKHHALFGDFTREVKAACYASEMGYDAVSNYIIGAIRNKLVQLADTYTDAEASDNEYFSKLHYREAILILLDISFYFFTLHPTVASSLRLSHTLVRAAQHLKNNDTEGFQIVREASLRWTSLLARSPTFYKLYAKSSVVPIEMLNILLSLQEFYGDGTLEAEVLDKIESGGGEVGYFQTVVGLYICGNSPALRDRKIGIFDRASARLRDEDDLIRDAESAHLALDLLACTFVSKAKREQLLVDIWPKLLSSNGALGTITNAKAKQLVKEIETQHWFVRWDGIDLLSMIEKKELSAVYA